AVQEGGHEALVTAGSATVWLVTRVPTGRVPRGGHSGGHRAGHSGGHSQTASFLIRGRTFILARSSRTIRRFTSTFRATGAPSISPPPLSKCSFKIGRASCRGRG